MKVVADISGNIELVEETEADLLQAQVDHEAFINSKDPYWLYMRKKLYGIDIDPALPVALSDYHLDNQPEALLALQARKAEIKALYPKTLVEYPQEAPIVRPEEAATAQPEEEA